MYREYTQEEFWKLYKTLPQNLKDSLSAEETGNNVEKVCQRHNINDKFSDILNLVGQVLLGLLPIEDFKKILVRDVGLDMTKSKNVAREIIRFIFFPVKEDLLQLYGIESLSKKVFKEESESPSPIQQDTYRELIE